MKLSFLLILFFLSHFYANAKIDPYYKEVIQRGYEHIGDTVIFPDGTKCSIKDFNEGLCGKKWKTDDYCIEEGMYVWDENRCCEGLAPFLEGENDGQPTCQQKEGWDFNFFSFWLGLLIPFVFFAYIIFNVRQKIRQRK